MGIENCCSTRADDPVTDSKGGGSSIRNLTPRGARNVQEMLKDEIKKRDKLLSKKEQNEMEMKIRNHILETENTQIRD